MSMNDTSKRSNQVQDRWVNFNKNVKKFIGRVSYSTLQLTFNKLPVECVKEEYTKFLKRVSSFPTMYLYKTEVSSNIPTKKIATDNVETDRRV